MRVIVSKVSNTISDCVDYVLKENEGGQLLMCNVGDDRDSIISFFENQQKKYGKNSIASLIVAQHRKHQISDEKWIEIFHDIFKELNLVKPRYVVGIHQDGLQAHCHALAAQWRPDQYLFNEKFRPYVSSKEYRLEYKKNKRLLEEKMFELARTLELKHNLPAMALSIHCTREYWIPSKYRYKDRQREIIDKALESAKSMEEFQDKVKEISSQVIPQFQNTLIEDKKIGYYNRIKNATEMTFEARKWCNNEFVFIIGDFACRGILLGPEYSRDAIERRVDQNFAELELALQLQKTAETELKPDIPELEHEQTKKNEAELKPNIQELEPEGPIKNLDWLRQNVHKLEHKETLEVVSELKLGSQKIQSEENRKVNELMDIKIVEQLCDRCEGVEVDDNVFRNQLKLELSIYERRIDESLEIKNNQCELQNVWSEMHQLTLFAVNQNQIKPEDDEEYELRMERIKSAEEYFKKITEREKLIQIEISKLIILHKEYLKKIERKRLLAEKKEEARIAEELLSLKREKEKALEAHKAKVNEGLCFELKITLKSNEFKLVKEIHAQRTNLSIKLMNNSLKLMNNSLKQILTKNGYSICDERKDKWKEVSEAKMNSDELNRNLNFLFENFDKSKFKCLKEFRGALIRIETTLLQDEEILSIDIENSNEKTQWDFSYHIQDELDVALRKSLEIDESQSKSVRLAFIRTVRDDILEISDYSKISNLDKLTHGINSLIWVLDHKEEIDNQVKDMIVCQNNELKREKAQRALRDKNRSHDNDQDHSQGLRL